MKIKAVFFDLDGTLLPMEIEAFTSGYFGLLAAKLAPLGYRPEAVVKGIWKGTAAMVRNNGSKTNAQAFWECAEEVFGKGFSEYEPLFEKFYAKEFQQCKDLCGFDPKAAEAVKTIKDRGFRTILATNPLFPPIATSSRIEWAGLSPSDFEFYTTYDNSHYCKPNPMYYREILDKIGLTAEECLMVGNDVSEDMIAKDIGMKVFLLSNCLINKENKELSEYPQGNFDDLIRFTDSL